MVNFNIYFTNTHDYIASSEAIKISLFISCDIMVGCLYRNTLLATEKCCC